MRLLFLTSRLPYPPNRGDRLRAYNFLRSLARQHEIHLVSFIAAESERAHIASLEQFCQRVQVLPMSPMRSALSVVLNIWRSQPLQALYYRSAAMQALIGQTLVETQFDGIYVHLFRMAQYVDNGRWMVDDDSLNYPTTQLHNYLTTRRPYRIVDLTDVISQELIRSMPYRSLPSRLIYAIERPRIVRYEHWLADHFEETWLISKHDQAILAAACPQANIRVIPNGVDTENLHPTGETALANSLIFVGHMGVFHNTDAASFLVREILPRVRAEIPEATVKLVGAAPSPQVQDLGRLPGVDVTGFMPDLNAALNQSAVFVAPLRFAAGVQNKVLEAMAAARPVVVTSLVNQGLGAQPGRDLLTADTSEQIAAAILNLLRDSAMRRQLGQAARQFVQAHYRWELVVERLQSIQENLL